MTPRLLPARRGGPSAQPKGRGSWLSFFSLWSFLSIGSLFSAGSILSIGSAGSILSIGSAGSILSIGSAGSVLAIGAAGSLPGRRSRPPHRPSPHQHPVAVDQ